MTTPLAGRIRDRLKKNIITAIINDEGVWEAIDKAIQEDLKDSPCYLLFDENPRIYVGLGSGDASRIYPIEICVSVDEGEDKEFLISQIKGIDKLITDLNNNRNLLTEALKRYPEEERSGG